ncbi:hypothetical protein LPJ56_003058 [Coemansia sp. RSA 2599]|nr:hypothetical protein LPJ56_003058 [Coemansia sp. RSA 2599]
MPRRTRRTQVKAVSSDEEDNTVEQEQQQTEELAQPTDAAEAQQEPEESEGAEMHEEDRQEVAAEQTEEDEANCAEEDEDEPEVFNDAQDAIDDELQESTGANEQAVASEDEDNNEAGDGGDKDSGDDDEQQEQLRGSGDDDGDDAGDTKRSAIRRPEAPNTVDMNDALTKARAIAAKLGTSMQRPIAAASVANESAASAAAAADVEQTGANEESNGGGSFNGVERAARQMDVRDRRSASPSESSAAKGGIGSRGHKRGRSTSRDRGHQRGGMDIRRDSRRRFDGPKAMGMPPMGGEPHGPMLEFQVPMDMVGLIIGRQGSNLRSIEQRHGVRIQMSQQFDRRDPERKITIEGPTQAAENARADIVEFIERHNSSKQAHGPPFRGGRMQQPISPMQPGFGADRGASGGPNSPPGMTTIMVPNAKVGLIIGRGGESIREIQKVSGARVQVEPDNGRGAPERPIQLIGLPGQIEFARARIMEIVNTERQGRDPMSGGGGGAGGGFRQEYGQPQGMPTPQHYQQPAPQPQQPFSPRGGPHSQPSFGMPQRGAYAEGMPGMPQPQPQHVEEIQVPSEAVGIIIGRGGENIKNLQQISGARIQIIQGQDRSAPFKPVTISGDQAACMRARRMIEEKIQSVQERQPGAPGAMGYSGGRGSQFAAAGAAPPSAAAAVSMPVAYDAQTQRGPGMAAPASQGGYGAGGGYGAQQYYGGQQPVSAMDSSKVYSGAAGYQGDYQAPAQQQQQQQAATGGTSGEQSYQWTNQQTADYYAQYAATNPEYAQYAEYYRKLAEKDPHGIVPS